MQEFPGTVRGYDVEVTRDHDGHCNGTGRCQGIDERRQGIEREGTQVPHRESEQTERRVQTSLRNPTPQQARLHTLTKGKHRFQFNSLALQIVNELLHIEVHVRHLPTPTSDAEREPRTNGAARGTDTPRDAAGKSRLACSSRNPRTARQNAVS